MSTKQYRILTVIFVIFVGIVFVKVYKNVRHSNQIRAIYNEAEDLIAEDNYTNARDILLTIKR